MEVWQFWMLMFGLWFSADFTISTQRHMLTPKWYDWTARFFMVLSALLMIENLVRP